MTKKGKARQGKGKGIVRYVYLVSFFYSFVSYFFLFSFRFGYMKAGDRGQEKRA